MTAVLDSQRREKRPKRQGGIKKAGLTGGMDKRQTSLNGEKNGDRNERRGVSRINFCDCLDSLTRIQKFKQKQCDRLRECEDARSTENPKTAESIGYCPGLKSD